MNDDRILIKDAKQGITNREEDSSGDTGWHLISIKFKQNGKSKWLHCTFLDAPSYKLSDEDLHENLLHDSYIDENLDYVNSLEIDEFQGFELGEVDFMIDEIANNPNNPIVPFIRCILMLYETDDDGFYEALSKIRGKYIDEIEFPPFNHFAELRKLRIEGLEKFGIEVPSDDELRKKWGFDEKGVKL